MDINSRIYVCGTYISNTEILKPILKVSAENATNPTNKEIIHTLSLLGVGGGVGGDSSERLKIKWRPLQASVQGLPIISYY